MLSSYVNNKLLLAMIYFFISKIFVIIFGDMFRDEAYLFNKEH